MNKLLTLLSLSLAHMDVIQWSTLQSRIFRPVISPNQPVLLVVMQRIP